MRVLRDDRYVLAMEPARKFDEPSVSAPAAPARLTWPEVKLAYLDQWVILTELDMDPVTLEIHTAVVRGHGGTRREAWETAAIPDDDGRTIAQLYTGRGRNPRPW